MKHATPTVLDAVEPLLQQLRAFDALTERKRGVFYRKSSAFLHFHEDPAGFFADVRIGPAWRRLPVTTAQERQALVRLVADQVRQAAPPAVGGDPSRNPRKAAHPPSTPARSTLRPRPLAR